MVLSLEELGPAVVQATNQGPDDTATAAAEAAAQPMADLGHALQPQTAGQVQAATAQPQQSSPELGSSGTNMILHCA